LSTTAINKRAEIDCFALHGSACTILTDRYPSVEDCMQCHFRKPEREVTNGVSYPTRITADDENRR
jgi:hypothetical protein